MSPLYHCLTSSSSSIISHRKWHYPPHFLLISLLFSLLISIPTSSGAAIADRPSNSSDFSEFLQRNVFDHKDKCYKESYVFIQEDEDDEDVFTVFSSTKDCTDRLREENLPEALPNCPPGLIDLRIKPTYVAKSQISYPYSNLNISIKAHTAVEAIFFRLECLSASDGSDVYCSDSKGMYINGVKEWPCRALSVSPIVRYPVHFTYDCFRLTPHSIYAINATILPQKCRSVQVVTAPSFDDVFPEVLVDPMDEDDLTSDPYWAPMISVDLTDDSGVWVRLEHAEQAQCDKMMVNVYKEHLNDSSKATYIETLEVKCPDTAVKWTNLKEGKYLLTAYVPIRGCKFICEPEERSCHQCLRTHLNVLIPESRASWTWLTVQTLKDWSYEIFIGSLFVIAILAVIMIVVAAVILYKWKQDSKRVERIQLTEYKKAMIVYADDNVEHSNCVRLLVECLQNCATCEPIFDMDQLITAENTVVPSRWLIDQISSLQKFIIIMSACGEKILDTKASSTHRLVQNRPFDDLFGPAMEMIIRDAMQNMSLARKKYVIVRFPYSPQVPANLAALNLKVFNIPEQFGQLTAFIHSVNVTSNANINQMLDENKLAQWELAIRIVNDHFRSYPNWIDSRWRPKDEPVTAFQPIVTPKFRTIKTHEDRVAASKRYNLHPPGEDSDEEEGPADETSFMLYPKKSGVVDSDSDSDNSDTKTLKEEDMLQSTESESNNTVVYLGPKLPTPAPSTEPSTEPLTEPSTESLMGPSTEPLTEPSTESLMGPSTEPLTEPPTEPPTESSVEPSPSAAPEPN